MPIKHTDKGWFWGSKGPFPTKAKALAVGRAAYAHGYKESIMDNAACAKLIQCLFHSSTNTHILHLQTRSYAEHVALGEYYDEIIDIADSIAEAYQGRYGIIEGYTAEYALPTTPIETLIAVSESIVTYRAQLPQDTEIQNLIDEAAALVDATLYKLRFLG